MNDELINRMDKWIRTVNIDSRRMHEAYDLVSECRAALSLSSEDKPTRYVPMTDDDFMRVDISTGMHDPKEAWAYERAIEAEVIRRAGLEVEK